MPIVVGGGSITGLATGGINGSALASGTVTQAKIADAVTSSGPAFSAYGSAYTSVPSTTYTKLSYNTKLFDTNNNYDTTLSRFTPTVAGYYQISGCCLLAAASSGAGGPVLYKNGSFFYYAYYFPLLTASANIVAGFSNLFYANGTDYFELYGYQTGGTLNMGSSSSYMTFSACLVRAA